MANERRGTPINPGGDQVESGAAGADSHDTSRCHDKGPDRNSIRAKGKAREQSSAPTDALNTVLRARCELDLGPKNLLFISKRGSVVTHHVLAWLCSWSLEPTWVPGGEARADGPGGAD